MNKKHVKYTVENLIYHAEGIAMDATEENDFLQALKTLEVAEDMLNTYLGFSWDDNSPEKTVEIKGDLEERITELKTNIGKDMLYRYKEKVDELIGIVLAIDL